MKIQICGPGCANCTKTEQVVAATVAELVVDAQIEKVTDFQEMAKLGVLSTPAVVLDGTIKCVGKVPSKDEVKSWF